MLMASSFDTLHPSFSWAASEVEWPVTSDVGEGLAGVVAAATEVVWMDPSSGILAYRGVPIEDLAFGSDFEEVSHLLITGREAEEDPPAYAAYRDTLRASRRLPDDVLNLLADMDPATHPTRMLRAGVSALGCHELGEHDDLEGARHWRELRIVGQVAGLVSAIAHRRRHVAHDPPPPEQSLAEGVLRALLGRTPAPHEIRTLDLAWVMFAAHGLDAPTFTSMIVASCLADPYANVVAGLSGLRGDRTGGASEAVLRQMAPLGDADAAGRWVDLALERGERIAGFGHATLSMPDPRVVVLRKALAAATRRSGRPERFEVVRAVEAEATRRLAPKGVHVNLNLYGAPLFHLLGAEPEEVPILVAAARMAGMVALVREALDSIRLMRPITRYVGEPRRDVPGGGESP
jgi:citrate synthase